MNKQYCIAALLIGASAAAGAAKYDYNSDRPGATDHALLSRYSGSILYMHGDPGLAVASMFSAKNGALVVDSLEGRVTNRVYWGPKGTGAIDVFRNYQSALKDAGFDIVYQCEEAQCKRDKTQEKMVRWVQKQQWKGEGASDFYIIRMFEYKPGFQYIHASKQGPGGPVHVQVALRAADLDGHSAQRVQQFVQIVEPVTVALGKVSVDAQAIGAALKREGRIALYGILFDTNQAVIKPESAAALEQMAQALRDDNALNVYIVGHTDSQGGLDANLALSRRRAEAVVDALRTRYGIAASRLQGHGVASLSPVGNNVAEDGRARNRRVEMVVR